MKLLILLCVINVLFAKHVKVKKKIKCEGVSVDGKMHEESVWINGIDRPYQLSYHGSKLNSTHVIYFSYNVGRINESSFEIGYAKYGSKVPTPIEKVKDGFATAISHRHGKIYFGGSNGIYVQNLHSPGDVVELVPKYNIWDLFSKDALYFITFPERRLHKHVGNSSEIQHHIHERIYQFAIDGEDDTFITNKTGLYMIKNGTNHRIHLKGSRVFRAIEVNKKGVAYFCGRNEVFVVDKVKHELREIAKIKNIFGLTFDEDDNIIYSDPHQIITLLPKPCKK